MNNPKNPVDSEKEFMNLELQLKNDLKKELDNYNSRLPFSNVEMDINATNIVKTLRFNGHPINLFYWDDDENFCLFDIYVKIRKKDQYPFTSKDILSLMRIIFMVEIASHSQNQYFRDFSTALFFDLINEQDVLFDENTLYLKLFSFKHLPFGVSVLSDGLGSLFISCRSEYNELELYDMDIILSGCNSIHETTHLDPLKYFIINNKQSTTFLIYNDEKYFGSFPKRFSGSQMLLFIVYPEVDHFDDELERNEIESIVFKMRNRGFMCFENDELIKVSFLGIDMYILCFDEKIRDIHTFRKYINLDFDFDFDPENQFHRNQFEDDETFIQINTFCYCKNTNLRLYINSIEINSFLKKKMV